MLHQQMVLFTLKHLFSFCGKVKENETNIKQCLGFNMMDSNVDSAFFFFF